MPLHLLDALGSGSALVHLPMRIQPLLLHKAVEYSGKTIVPFATSGGSGMGKTNDALKPSCKEATLLEGKVFKATVTKDELAAWASHY